MKKPDSALSADARLLPAVKLTVDSPLGQETFTVIPARIITWTRK